MRSSSFPRIRYVAIPDSRAKAVSLQSHLDPLRLHQHFRHDLLHLQRQDPTTPITLYINSPGGEVQSGLALYDVMQAVSCPIRTVCLGMAASMGALLFIAGDEREILPHSRIMIHDPLIGAGADGSALSVKARADDLMRIRDITAGVIARHSGMSIERVFELTASDTYFEAEEAVDAGLADRVITRL
ncbi:ClpP family protease [Senegalimassilia anaerobia]|uniref:ClpP family protease n=1 Tax=Senegalimassilia anaerobia TaxID=1473216 RepID=UPI003AB9996A